MAERDPNLAQSSDPELQADLVRLLQVQGPLGMLNVLDVVVPTVSLGQVVPLTVEIRTPVFRSTDIFTTGLQTNQAAGTLLADTGQLADGDYDVMYYGSSDTSIASSTFAVEHRNAANAANLARWEHQGRGEFSVHPHGPFVFGYRIGPDERLRIIQVLGPAAGVGWIAAIFARRRT